MARVCAVEARICTWEVVTGFRAGDLSREMLEDCFRRDFPDFEGMPRFWKMVSFNSAEGRRHRYLVIHGVTELRGRRERMVPRSIALFAMADREMRLSGATGNYRFAAIAGECLYVLVFYEGRLCHWSEERGYGGKDSLEQAGKRVESFDTFLREDPLFSQGEEFVKSALIVLDTVFENPSGAWRTDLKNALRDPFWKGFHLEPRSRKKQTAKSIILLLLLMVTGITIWKNLEPGCETLAGPEAPALSLPPVTKSAVKSEPKESGFRDVVKPFSPRNTKDASAPACFKPVLEIQWIVGDRLFSGVFGGENVVKRAGDSLASFWVKSVLRDRVVLECGDKEWEVLNGESP